MCVAPSQLTLSLKLCLPLALLPTGLEDNSTPSSTSSLRAGERPRGVRRDIGGGEMGARAWYASKLYHQVHFYQTKIHIILTDFWGELYACIRK